MIKEIEKLKKEKITQSQKVRCEVFNIGITEYNRAIDDVIKILNKHFVVFSEAEVCVHPFRFVVIHGSRCHCLKCGCDIDTQT